MIQRIAIYLFIAFGAQEYFLGLPIPDISKASVLATSEVPTGLIVTATLLFPASLVAFGFMALSKRMSGLLGLAIISTGYTVLFFFALLDTSDSWSRFPDISIFEANAVAGLFIFLVSSAYFLRSYLASKRSGDTPEVVNEGWVMFALLITINLAAIVGFTHLNKVASEAPSSSHSLPSNNSFKSPYGLGRRASHAAP